MAILKSEIRNKYSQIPNSVIRAKDVTDGDYRLLIYLYSLPNGWKINQGYLGTELNCNRRNISSKIKRLKEAGYLEIIRANKEGDTDYIYVLKEKDVSSSDVSVDNVSSSDVSVNDVYINTNKINTEKINNELNNYSTTTSKGTDLFEFIEKSFGRTLSSSEYEFIQKWEDNELTRYAIKQAELARAFNVKYIDKILFNYQKENIKTVAEAEERDKKFKESKGIQRKTYKTPQEKTRENLETVRKELEARNELRTGK